MLKDISTQDISFIRDELCDVLEMLPPEFMEKASLKLERTILFIRLVMEEMGHGKTSNVGDGKVREMDQYPEEASGPCTAGRSEDTGASSAGQAATHACRWPSGW